MWPNRCKRPAENVPLRAFGCVAASSVGCERRRAATGARLQPSGGGAAACGGKVRLGGKRAEARCYGFKRRAAVRRGALRRLRRLQAGSDKVAAIQRRYAVVCSKVAAGVWRRAEVWCGEAAVRVRRQGAKVESGRRSQACGAAAS